MARADDDRRDLRDDGLRPGAGERRPAAGLARRAQPASFGHSSTASGRRPAARRTLRHDEPGDRQAARRGGPGGAADVDAAVAAARAALPGWWALGGHGRARYLYALARQIQKHSRLLAVLETLDNGKPIRETRDIDIPLVARHFYHHAGWAQLMDARAARATAPVGVVGQIIPWNFPLLMLAWKIAPALAVGNTVVLKPAEFTSLTALAFAEICQRRRPAAGRGQHRHRRRPHRRADRQPSRRRQDRLHRLDRGRPHHPQGHRGHRQEAVAGAGRQVALHRLRRRRSRQRGRRAWSTRSGSTRARSAAPARGCWCRRASPSASTTSCARAWRRCASATRSTRRSTSARSSRRCSSSGSTRLVRAGRGGGRHDVAALLGLPDATAASIPPTLFTDVAPAATIAQVEIFGPVLVAMTFRTPERGGRAGQQHPLRPRRQRVDREHQPRARRGAPRSRPAWSGSTAPTSSTPPPASAATARAASAAKAARRGCTST